MSRGASQIAALFSGSLIDSRKRIGSLLQSSKPMKSSVLLFGPPSLHQLSTDLIASLFRQTIRHQHNLLDPKLCRLFYVALAHADIRETEKFEASSPSSAATLTSELEREILTHFDSAGNHESPANQTSSHAEKVVALTQVLHARIQFAQSLVRTSSRSVHDSQRHQLRAGKITQQAIATAKVLMSCIESELSSSSQTSSQNRSSSVYVDLTIFDRLLKLIQVFPTGLIRIDSATLDRFRHQAAQTHASTQQSAKIAFPALADLKRSQWRSAHRFELKKCIHDLLVADLNQTNPRLSFFPHQISENDIASSTSIKDCLEMVTRANPSLVQRVLNSFPSSPSNQSRSSLHSNLQSLHLAVWLAFLDGPQGLKNFVENVCRLHSSFTSQAGISKSAVLNQQILACNCISEFVELYSASTQKAFPVHLFLQLTTCFQQQHADSLSQSPLISHPAWFQALQSLMTPLQRGLLASQLQNRPSSSPETVYSGRQLQLPHLMYRPAEQRFDLDFHGWSGNPASAFLFFFLKQLQLAFFADSSLNPLAMLASFRFQRLAPPPSAASATVNVHNWFSVSQTSASNSTLAALACLSIPEPFSSSIQPGQSALVRAHTLRIITGFGKRHLADLSQSSADHASPLRGLLEMKARQQQLPVKLVPHNFGAFDIELSNISQIVL